MNLQTCAPGFVSLHTLPQPISPTVTVGMGCTPIGTVYNSLLLRSLLSLGLQLCLPFALFRLFRFRGHTSLKSELAGSVIIGLGGWARPLLLVLLLTLFCYALLQVIALSCRRTCYFSPGFQCCVSLARQLHVVVSGGCLEGPRNSCICFSHATRAQQALAGSNSSTRWSATTCSRCQTSCSHSGLYIAYGICFTAQF